MKKKGFTLIELLAVIVVLAIIALIATPMVLGVIEKARIGASLESARGYVDAIEKQILINSMENVTILDGTYTIEDEKIPMVRYKGKGPSDGKITFKNDSVLQADLCINGYSIQYSAGTVKKVIDSYCNKDSFDYAVKLTVDNTVLSKTIGILNTVSFDVDQTNESSWLSLQCTNGAIGEYQNGKVIVKNITKSSTCKLYTNMKEAIAETPKNESKTNIVMLKDEIIEETIATDKNQNIVFSLSGKNILAKESFTGVLFDNSGTISFVNETDQESKMISYNSVFLNQRSAKATINNISIISNSTGNSSAICNQGKLTIESGYVEGIFAVGCHSNSEAVTTIHDGTFIARTENALQLNTGYSANAYIYGGNFVAEKGFAIVNNGTGNIDIYGGTFMGQKAGVINTGNGTVYLKDGNFVSNTAAVQNSLLGSITIDGGIYTRMEGTGTTIYNKNNGRITINDGIFKNTSSGYVIQNGLPPYESTGIININGGIIISSFNTAIHNYSAKGIININGTDNPIYITSLAVRWAPVVVNNSIIDVNIKGKEADQCTSNPSDTTMGLCIYAEGNKDNSSNTSNGAISNVNTGTINIDGGTIYGGFRAINNSSNGTINITKSNISSGNYAIYNNSTGIVNICSAKIDGANRDLYNSSTGKIFYTPNVILKNNTIYDFASNNPSHVVLKNDTVCKSN